MVCPACKTPNPKDCTECSACGSELEEFTRVVNNAPAKKPAEQASIDQDWDSTHVSRSAPVVSSAAGDEGTIVSKHDTNVTEKTPPDESKTSVNSGQGPGLSTFMSPIEEESGAVCLLPNTLLAGRYKILKELGEGGMGSVYKAHDVEVDRMVAIKVIRPELASDPQILQRFKQELILARQVTHRNVVRIFDLGVAEHLKFISMEFIEGRELTSLLEESGKLPPKQAADIMLQVCRGLEAAHAEGVVHRDLKPQNIMIDAQGRAAVMDFGIAYSVGGTDLSGTGNGSLSAHRTGAPALTQLGSLIGTPRYMSPEQAKSEPVDARSDIFTVGIIFYELLTGIAPFTAKTRKETLRKRIEEAPRPPIELDPRIPKRLNQIVLKCLEKDKANRYASATELIHDLEIWLGIRSSIRAAQVRRMRLTAAGLTLLLVGAGGFITWNQMRLQANRPHALVKVLLSDFQNRTGQPIFNKTLEPIMRDDLERASFINVYNPAAARQIAAQLKPGTTEMDDASSRLVALREGLGIIVSAGIEKHGSGYRLWVKELNAGKGDTVLSKDTDVASTAEIPQGVEKLAARVRRSLGDSSGTPKKMAEETFTSASLAAAQQYSEAQDLQWSGKWDDSIAAYHKAIQLDPNLSRAYAGLAITYQNRGQRDQADKYYRLALQHVDQMSDREKYRTLGGYYLNTRDYQKAAEQFRALVAKYPADTAGLNNLALSDFYARNMADALVEGQRALDIFPNNVLIRNNVGLYAMYAGDFDRAIKESEIILKQNPSFDKAYLCLAISYLAKGQPIDAEATYKKMAGLSKWGSSEAALGLADMSIYQGQLEDAVQLLQKGMAEDTTNSDKAAASLKQVIIAAAEMSRHQRPAALTNAEKAAQASDDESVLYPAAEVFLEEGETAKAQHIADQLDKRFEPQPRALGTLIYGEIKMKDGKLPDAVSYFQDAQKLADTWLGRFDLGRAYLAAGSYPDAENEFDVCIKRRGEATAVFLDDNPTVRYIAPVYYYEGRAREGLQSPSAAEFYKTFLNIKQDGEADPLVADAKRRLK